MGFCKSFIFFLGSFHLGKRKKGEDEREAREREKVSTQKHTVDQRVFFCKRSQPTGRVEDVGVLTSAKRRDRASFSGVHDGLTASDVV